MLYLDIAFSHHVYFQPLGNCSQSQDVSDEGLPRLHNNQRPRREPVILLQRAERIFPALKDCWVSVLGFECLTLVVLEINIYILEKCIYIYIYIFVYMKYVHYVYVV
jgi:hypothetical protein